MNYMYFVCLLLVMHRPYLSALEMYDDKALFKFMLL